MTTTVPDRHAGMDPAYGWDSAHLDLDAYLERVGYGGELTPTPDTLRGLHRAHAAAIPFENLEILLGGAIEIDLESLQRKLVTGRRGGYCYEHNLLFAAVLERLGYRLTGLAARIRMGSDTLRPISHALLRVEVDGADWIADVGFGGEGLLEPIPLANGTEVSQGAWTYRLDRTGPGDWVLRSRHPEGWFDLYGFTLEPRYRVDYRVFNHFTSTHPRSPFTQRIVAQRTGAEVRRTLVGAELTETRGDGGTTQRELAPEEVPSALADLFGLPLEEERARRLVRLLVAGDG